MVNTSNSNPEVPEGMSKERCDYRHYLGRVYAKIVSGFDPVVEVVLPEINDLVSFVPWCLDRSLTLQQVIEATGSHLFLMNASALETVSPRNTGIEENVIVQFFRIGYQMTPEEVDQKYESLNLMPADLYTMAAVNKFLRFFGFYFSSATQWNRDGQKVSFALFFYHVYDGHRVNIGRGWPGRWDSRWWFAGVRKKK